MTMKKKSIKQMPTYDYECSKCKHSFELFQTFSEEKLTKCPKCNKKSLERLFGIGIHCHVENVTTIGQLGERNAKKAGKCKADEKAHEYAQTDIGNPKARAKRKLNKEINKIQDKRKYIETGIK